MNPPGNPMPYELDRAPAPHREIAAVMYAQLNSASPRPPQSGLVFPMLSGAMFVNVAAIVAPGVSQSAVRGSRVGIRLSAQGG